MALISADLANKLIGAVRNGTDASVCQSKLAAAINDYIKSNALVYGVYVGLTITTPPISDPAGTKSPFQWKCLTCNISGSKLLSAAQGGWEAWMTSVAEQIKSTTTFGNNDTTNIITVGAITVVNITLSGSLSKMTDMDTIMKKLAGIITSGLQSAIVLTSLPGKSATPGTGTVTFTNIS